jgi:outer membrane protein assembly factor BamB
MKPVVAFIAFISLVLFSCSKEYSVESVPSTLKGTWRMFEVKDDHSGTLTTKPPDLSGDVVITFTATGNISGVLVGHTPTNIISESGYTTGINQVLTIPALNITKLWETPWGEEFVANICSTLAYHFDSDGHLMITTTNKTLIFEPV